MSHFMLGRLTPDIDCCSEGTLPSSPSSAEAGRAAEYSVTAVSSYVVEPSEVTVPPRDWSRCRIDAGSRVPKPPETDSTWLMFSEIHGLPSGRPPLRAPTFT